MVGAHQVRVPDGVSAFEAIEAVEFQDGGPE